MRSAWLDSFSIEWVQKDRVAHVALLRDSRTEQPHQAEVANAEAKEGDAGRNIVLDEPIAGGDEGQRGDQSHEDGLKHHSSGSTSPNLVGRGLLVNGVRVNAPSNASLCRMNGRTAGSASVTSLRRQVAASIRGCRRRWSAVRNRTPRHRHIAAS
jgi:hypothetical protein